jgi:hypothetical protein
VVLDGGDATLEGREYNLAGYLMINNGNDAVTGTQQFPDNYWAAAYDANLGDAEGARYSTISHAR